MRLVKIAIAALDATVGAVRSNVDHLIDRARAMAADDTTVGCLPEQIVGGYPAEDLVQWRAFVAEQRRGLERFSAATSDLGTVFVVGLTVAVDAQLFNCAAVVHGGRILGFVPKEQLPTYDVFYERRTFSRGSPGLALDAGGVPLGDLLFDFDFGRMAVEVCEDVWSPDGPMRRRCYSGAEVVVNVSASPFRTGIHSTRREMLATRSADSQTVLAYANRVGGQDGLVFDGGGFIHQNGRLLVDAPRFREGYYTAIVDLDRTRRLRVENTTWRADYEAFQQGASIVTAIRSTAPTRPRSGLAYPAPAGGDFFLPPAAAAPTSSRDEALDELFEALALGLKDYFVKVGSFGQFGVAVSGGRDSLLTLLVAWHASSMLREGRTGGSSKDSPLITAFYMPSRYSGEATRDAARTICRELHVPLRESPIDEAFEREVEATAAMLEGAPLSALTRQNIQARIRAARMWNWANSAGALFLQTGDMSEKAVGYTTIGGDLEGGLSVIANVPKTVVVALLERLHARFGFEGIRAVLATQPGPELAEDQIAEHELMPFTVLDACLHLYVGEKMAPDEVARALPSIFPTVAADRLAAWAERFVRLFTGSIYKWVQSPLALHVGSLDLDRERALQLPVVQRGEWRDTPDES